MAIVSVYYEFKLKALKLVAEHSLRDQPTYLTRILDWTLARKDDAIGAVHHLGSTRRLWDCAAQSGSGSPPGTPADISATSSAMRSLWLGADGTLTEVFLHVTARGAILKGSMLSMLTEGSLHQIMHNRPGRKHMLKMLAKVNSAIAPHVQESSNSSYLSQTRNAKFFRRLAAAFPELLDLVCSTDPRQTSKIAKLVWSLRFLSFCIASIKDQKGHLHTAVCFWLTACLPPSS